MAAKAPNCPTRPLVPIPAPEAVLVILKRQVETGPKMAEDKVGAIQIWGWRIMLENWSIEVPIP